MSEGKVMEMLMSKDEFRKKLKRIMDSGLSVGSLVKMSESLYVEQLATNLNDGKWNLGNDWRAGASRSSLELAVGHYVAALDAIEAAGEPKG